jgi:peptidoglycan/LPS O-acetylase OafA/YrhL
MGSLRFLLALAVAGGHAASFFGFSAAWILPGSRAVQIFYIISGFLMAMILNGKYADSPHGNWIFYTNRAVKIFAPYFAILAVTIAICLLSKLVTGNALLLESWFAEAGSMTFSTWAFALLTNIFIIGQEWAFLLIYRTGSLYYSLQAFAEPPTAFQFIVIGPAWTLSLELMFYLIAPFIVRRHILLIAALAYASYYYRFEAYHFGYYSEATNYRFFPFELSLFLYGSICFRLGKVLLPTDAKTSAAMAAAVVTLIVFLPRHFLENQYQLYAIVGVLLPALFDFSRRSNWDRSLGGLSYPLYLVHWPVFAFIASLVRAIDPSSIGKIAAFPIVAIAIAIAASVLINRYIVNPIDDWRQTRAKTAEIVSA